MIKKYGPSMTWEEIAKEYPGNYPENVKSLPFNEVFYWAKKQKKVFYSHPKYGTIHKILKKG